jgi:RNA polymerase sigma factor (sigma-70 family)
VGDPGLAEEVAQDALVRIWREGARFDARKGSVGTWLSAITRNLAIDSLRRRRAEPVDPETFLALTATDGDPIDQVTRREDMQWVGTAVRELPRAQRRALLLSVFFDRTAAEVSRIEQIPLGTAKTRIRTAILQLRATLSKHLPAAFVAAACAAGASPVRPGCPASTTSDGEPGGECAPTRSICAAERSFGVAVWAALNWWFCFACGVHGAGGPSGLVRPDRSAA